MGSNARGSGTASRGPGFSAAGARQKLVELNSAFEAKKRAEPEQFRCFAEFADQYRYVPDDGSVLSGTERLLLAGWVKDLLGHTRVTVKPVLHPDNLSRPMRMSVLTGCGNGSSCATLTRCSRSRRRPPEDSTLITPSDGHTPGSTGLISWAGTATPAVTAMAMAMVMAPTMPMVLVTARWTTGNRRVEQGCGRSRRPGPATWGRCPARFIERKPTAAGN